MEVRVAVKNGIHILTVEGDLDMYNTPVLKDAFTQIIDKDASKLLLNLEGVEYLDSSGVAVLLYIHATSSKRHIPFYISGIREQPSKVLELTKLINYLPLTRSLNNGIAKLTSKIIAGTN